MAHTDSLPNNVLDVIAEQIGNSLPKLGSQTFSTFSQNQASVELGETFPIWLLPGNEITQGITNISQLAIQTNRWHHQIKFNGNAAMFARSIPKGIEASSWSVREIVDSTIARSIDTAIDWIDQNVRNDPLVRLLVVPAYQLTAFWLLDRDNSQVIAVDFPPQFTNLEPYYLYSSQEFLNALLREQHETGIIYQV